ncbi:hypothetical protein DFQ26_009681, partial [Actinomortierella ambigua]
MPLSTTNFIPDESTLTDGETETEGDTTESETEARSKRAPRASTPLTQLVTAMETTHVRSGRTGGEIQEKTRSSFILEDKEDSDVEDVDDLDSIKKWQTLLNNDTTILEKSKGYQPLGADRQSRLIVKFSMLDVDFFGWLHRHQQRIRTQFRQHRTIPRNNGKESIEYLCECSGKKTVHHDRTPGGKTNKKRHITKTSKKLMCPARLYVTLDPPSDVGGFRWASVTYRYMHTHPVGLARSPATCPLSDAMRERIKSQLVQGSTIEEILVQAKKEREKKIDRMRINNERPILARDDVIQRGDVYNIWYYLLTKEMVKGATPVLSSIEWMKEFKKEGGMVYYDEQDTVDGRYFGFATTWQTDQLYSYGDTSIVLDGAHHVYGDVGCGVPVAFLLTTTQEVHVLSGWLRAIRIAMKNRYSTEERPYELRPTAFITDQGSAEISAFRSAFGGLGVQLHFCSWHIDRIWIRELSKRVVYKPGDTLDQKKELRSR